MRTRWARLKDDTWGVCMEGFSGEPGDLVEVERKGGTKRKVVLGEQVHSFQVYGGPLCTLFRVEEKA